MVEWAIVIPALAAVAVLLLLFAPDIWEAYCDQRRVDVRRPRDDSREVDPGGEEVRSDIWGGELRSPGDYARAGEWILRGGERGQGRGADRQEKIDRLWAGLGVVAAVWLITDLVIGRKRSG